MNFVTIKSLLLSGIVSVSLTGAALAQNLFAPVVKVNDQVVTEYEVQQRMRFLQTLNAPGGDRDASLEALIDDRLRQGAASAAGLALNPDGIDAAMTEFASRVNLDKDAFIAALAQNGVSEQTFRDYVVIGTLWRELVRSRYGNLVQISEDEIDRALAATIGSTGLQVLVSEIILPIQPGNEDAAFELAQVISQSPSPAIFSDYARQYSAAPTRVQGGRLDWQPLSGLPESLRPLLLGLAPGDVTAPLNIPGALALFQLRDIAETPAGQAAQDSAIDYAVYEVPSADRAADIIASIDVCDDLFGVALANPSETLVRETLTPDKIPSAYRSKLTTLDENESVTLTGDGGVTLLMLCGRTAVINQDASRTEVANSLRGARLEAYAATFLEQLRADARLIWQ
jgi:peptidyl-prolyl cis-trans isomerase SurA